MDYLYTVVHNLPVQYILHITFALYYSFMSVCVCLSLCTFVLAYSCNSTYMKVRGQLVGLVLSFHQVCLKDRSRQAQTCLLGLAIRPKLNLLFRFLCMYFSTVYYLC